MSEPALAESRYREAAMPLRAAVWDPIARHLAGASRVYLVPDGQLNLVNFASLPASRGGYLAEGTTTLHYLTTERDLLVDAPPAAAMTALVVGRPAFGGTSRGAVGTSGTTRLGVSAPAAGNSATCRAAARRPPTFSVCGRAPAVRSRC
jgi:hypothetical protein